MQKIEARVAADEDLKLADLLKYYLRESQAAKVKWPYVPQAISHLLYKIEGGTTNVLKDTVV